ncbi:TetR/AcrR family transcriptional regulator [Nocardioides guangzhouensis]|uniref:TetR/AcrR family transcriptional regulator n=1 Tax=Nocardioides guangzhouensis TaxID=2497878 RepID=A0A4Q4ZLL2_9ACTN|nr:TetR/AcrR family transcriptional regulator [Nocardioides guangzhouensis]RYP88948.1 TetR/AcrR family transcriptional regulator [Nocardioides guangzhouensis]
MTPHAPDSTAVRPRVEGDRELEILAATLEVLADVGYDRLTMDAVATRAKASKATLYRRWNDKASLVVDALVVVKHSPEEPADTGTLRGDLIASFCGMGGLTDQQGVATFASVLTAISKDQEFATAFRRDVLGPKIAATSAIYERARARGEIRDDVDLDLLAPALAGVILHRFFLLGEQPTEDVIVRVIDQIILPAATNCGRPGGQ